MPRSPESIPTPTARRLLMGGLGLLADPARRATPTAVHKQIEQMGFVQVDTINIVERAHHTILRTRFEDYEPRMLYRLLERDRKLFEHWTHDASIIPACWFHCWRVRFDRYQHEGLSSNPWWARRMGGDPQPVIDHVLERIEAEGPLMSRDFGRGSLVDHVQPPLALATLVSAPLLTLPAFPAFGFARWVAIAPLAMSLALALLQLPLTLRILRRTGRISMIAFGAMSFVRAFWRAVGMAMGVVGFVMRRGEA